MTQLLEINPTGYYNIDQSSQLYWPFEIARGSAWQFSVSHTSFYNNQTFSVRFWVSKTPGGISVSGWPTGTWRFVSATKAATRFVIYDSLQAGWQFPDVLFSWGVVRDQTYYLNVQNVENKHNSFYLDRQQLFRDEPM